MNIQIGSIQFEASQVKSLASLSKYQNAVDSRQIRIFFTLRSLPYIYNHFPKIFIEMCAVFLRHSFAFFIQRFREKKISSFIIFEASRGPRVKRFSDTIRRLCNPGEMYVFRALSTAHLLFERTFFVSLFDLPFLKRIGMEGLKECSHHLV